MGAVGIDVTPATLLYGDLVAGAAVASWIVVRFPRLAPTTFLGSIASFGLAQVLAGVVSELLPMVVRSPGGVVTATVGLVFPIFLVFFLTTIWLIKALLGGGQPMSGSHLRSTRKCSSTAQKLDRET